MNLQDPCKDKVCTNDKNIFKNKNPFAEPSVNLECPLSKNLLGRYTWSFLHTVAIFYPQNPTEEQKKKMLGFLQGFKEFFPCQYCLKHFVKEYEKYPPNVQSNKQLSQWFCKQHNIVNKKLGKQQFDCSWQNIQMRWKTGNQKCQ